MSFLFLFVWVLGCIVAAAALSVAWIATGFFVVSIALYSIEGQWPTRDELDDLSCVLLAILWPVIAIIVAVAGPASAIWSLLVRNLCRNEEHDNV